MAGCYGADCSIICDTDCSNEGQCVGDCTTVDGDACVFPFEYQGETHIECTKKKMMMENTLMGNMEFAKAVNLDLVQVSTYTN